jgi:limonene-1,2-epoxide hydrolase
VVRIAPGLAEVTVAKWFMVYNHLHTVHGNNVDAAYGRESGSAEHFGCEDGAMTDASEIVLHLWRALASRDWEAVKTVVSDDCIFMDIPLGPTMAARGPDDIVKRLRTMFDNDDLATYANHDGVILSDGADVIYEHLEIFTSTDGETANNPIVSVHKVSDGKVTLWKDYWDLNAMANTSWFQSSAAQAEDFSWIFDATGLV